MTRIFTDGAEMGDIQFWDFVAIDGALTVATWPLPIGGTYSYRGCWNGAYRITPDLTEFYLRYRVLVNVGGPGSLFAILGWRHESTGIGGVSFDALGRFTIGITGITTISSSVVVELDAWYLIEIHYLMDAVAGRLELYIDGELAVDYTGNTVPSPAAAHVDNILFQTNAYGSVYIDDLALNDVNGAEDNSWCGDGIITKMIPDGDGEHNNWTNSDGDSVANWSYVDEYPNDGDLTYVARDGTDSGVQDQYTLTDLDYTNKTVLRIYPEARVRKSSPDGSRVKLGILPNGGVDDMSASKQLFADYFARIVGDEYLVNPFDSSPWDESNLDPLQLVIEVA